MRRLLLAGLLGLASLTACGSDDPDTVTVFAASSLTDAFTEMNEAFSAEESGQDVVFNFAASSVLARQVAEGAPADVVVTADQTTMQPLTSAGHVGEASIMARNQLTIVVEKGNPKGIRGLGDLGRPDVVLVLCAPEVPCGRLAGLALAKAGVNARPVSAEENVRAVTSKVVLGEADAGIAYLTDAKAEADRVDSIAIDSAADLTLQAVYPIAVVSDAANPKGAQAWVDFTLSRPGQAVLARYGFLPP